MSSELQPVVIEHWREHPFKKREKRGCSVCGHGKALPAHHGAPPSMNALGSGNVFAYQNAKKLWQALFIEKLEQADLQRPLARVVVEGQVCFPDRIRRDQGNHRFFIEKALGDALTDGGWLADDDWTRYEFGGLQATYEKGVSWTRLMLFPTALEEALAA